MQSSVTRSRVAAYVHIRESIIANEYADEKWGRRLICLLIAIVWLGIMLFPTFAFVLMRNEQIEIGATRIFMLLEEDVAGIGVQTSRPARTEDDVSCQRGSIFYIVWQGETDGQMRLIAPVTMAVTAYAMGVGVDLLTRP